MNDSEPGPRGPRPGFALGLTRAKPARHALGWSAANLPAERLPSELFIRRDGRRSDPDKSGLAQAENRAGAGRTGAAGPRGPEAGKNPRSPPPAWPAAFTVPVAAQQTEATEAARDPLRSSRPAGSPHLDLPTPLSPMMRIFRVVSTSSSILTLLRSQPSWPPGSGSQPFTREKCPRLRTAARLPPSFLPGV